MDRTIHTLLGAGICLLLSSCASLTIKNVNYEWPVESVLTVDESNIVGERQRSVSFSVGAIAMEEFHDSTALKGKTIRLIRNAEGFYFLTSARFKNVYILQGGERELRLHACVAVSETGLSDPAFNRRTPYVELLDGPSFSRLLTSKNLVEGNRQ
jgi:hypothetical protein